MNKPGLMLQRARHNAPVCRAMNVDVPDNGVETRYTTKEE